MTKKQKAQLLADKIQPMLQLIDMFINDMSDEDFKLLKESEETLSNHISMQHSAVTLTSAFGIKTDTLEEEHKLKTLNLLIYLLEERKQYKEDMLQQQLEKETLERNRKELMNIFGNL